MCQQRWDDLCDADLLAAVADRLLSSPAADLPGPVALERCRALLLQTERLRAAALEAVRDLDARELYALDGAGNAAVWLSRQRVGGRAAPLTTARRLDGHATASTALADGTLDVLGAERVCAALAKLPQVVEEPVVSAVLGEGALVLLQELSGGADPDPAGTAAVLEAAAAAVGTPLSTRVEPVFVLVAQRVAPVLLVRTLSVLVDALLPEEHLQRWEDQQAETYLDVRELLDGYADVKGVLDPETAVAFRQALARRALAARRGGDGLTAGQRRVLALRQLLRDASAQAGDRSEQEQVPDVEEPGADEDESVESDGPFGPHALDVLAEAAELVEQSDPDEADQPIGEGGTGLDVESDRCDLDRALDAQQVDDQQVDDQQVDAQPQDDQQVLAHQPAPGTGPDQPRPCPPAAEGQGVQLTLVERTPQRLTTGGPVPLVAGVDTVLGLPGALPGRYGPGLSTSLPVEAVRRLGCGGHLVAILLDAQGTPIGASGTHRHATERERRALLAQWGGTCATDGCGRPGVVPHHAEPWWLTRRTRLKDLVPYCDGCHHDLHEGGKTIKLRNGRWIGPTGWTDPPAGSLDLA